MVAVSSFIRYQLYVKGTQMALLATFSYPVPPIALSSSLFTHYLAI